MASGNTTSSPFPLRAAENHSPSYERKNHFPSLYMRESGNLNMPASIPPYPSLPQKTLLSLRGIAGAQAKLASGFAPVLLDWYGMVWIGLVWFGITCPGRIFAARARLSTLFPVISPVCGNAGMAAAGASCRSFAA